MNLKSDVGEGVSKASSNRNKSIACGVCGKTMRSDTLRRHTIAKHNDSASSFEHEYHDEDKIVLSVFPSNQKVNAQKILQYLRKHGRDVISWNSNGDVSMYGSNLHGTNIIDLIDDVLQTSQSSKHVNDLRERFLTALGDVNVPETLIKNEMALKRYRKIKNNYNDSTEGYI